MLKVQRSSDVNNNNHGGCGGRRGETRPQVEMGRGRQAERAGGYSLVVLRKIKLDI